MKFYCVNKVIETAVKFLYTFVRTNTVYPQEY